MSNARARLKALEASVKAYQEKKASQAESSRTDTIKAELEALSDEEIQQRYTAMLNQIPFSDSLADLKGSTEHEIINKYLYSIRGQK